MDPPDGHGFDSAMFMASPLAQEVLDDIQRRTGLSSRRIGGFDPAEKSIAEQILPILVEWVPKVEDVNLRHALYALFVTPHAQPFLSQVLEWWQTAARELPAISPLEPIEVRAAKLRQKSEMALIFNTLSFAVAAATKEEDASTVWSVYKQIAARKHDLSRRDYFSVPAKVAGLVRSPASREARDYLVEQLHTRNDLKVYELQIISGVHDPRIREWFLEQRASPEREIRRIAERVAKRGEALPKGLRFATSLPDYSQEVYSTGADVDQLPSLFRTLIKKLNLKVPSSLRQAKFLASLDVDRWVIAMIEDRDGQPLELWYRLEDVDVVDILIARPASTRTVQ